MTSAYNVKTENFSGPLEKLLELIEIRDLDITTVSLAVVTADFLNYLHRLESLEQSDAGSDRLALHRLVSDFIVVAAKLILIKSRQLLPQLELSPEEAEDIFDLEKRVKLYKEIKTASQHLRALWSQPRRSFSRELYQHRPSLFYLPVGLTAADLLNLAANLSHALSEQLAQADLPRPKIVSLAAKIKELLSYLSGPGSSLSFSGLKQSRDRGEIIALFLAILHLLRDRLIDIEQSSPFGDLTIKKRQHGQ